MLCGKGKAINTEGGDYREMMSMEKQDWSESRSIPPHTPPGLVLKAQLDARGWTPNALAEIIGRSPKVVNGIIEARTHITPDTAIRLAQALDTSIGFWYSLEVNYRFHLARRRIQAHELAQIRRKSRLYTLTPVDELIQRGWIDQPKSLDDLEEAVCAFLGINSAQEVPSLAVALHPSQQLEPKTTAQIAWLRRVEHLAWQQEPLNFERGRFMAEIPQLLCLASLAEKIVEVPQKLREMGIHFVIVPELPPAIVDGATYVEAGRHIVALTLRKPEIDAFWFTLMRQLACIALGYITSEQDGLFIGDAGKQSQNADEAQKVQAADKWAADQLLPPEKYQAFITESAGNFSRANIRAFAKEILRHPGIIVGCLKHDGLLRGKWHRRLQVNIYPAFCRDDTPNLRTTGLS